MNVRNFILSLLVFICISSHNYSQDLKGGEINVRNVSGLTYEATVFLYQNISTLVNRPFIVLHWDGAGDTLFGSTVGCGDSSTITQMFQGTHTYTGSGIDTVWSVDSFRVADINNISNSINEKLLLKYGFKVGLPGVYNSSPVFLNCAHDFWYCCNWVYNPGASDPDQDSLSFKLVDPFTANYTFPSASIDSVTGDLTFNPTTTGIYSFCIQVDEWREISTTYVLIGSSYRQIQIDVYSLTGTDEFDRQSVILFPNPFSTEAVLETTYPLRDATIKVVDCFGQTINQMDHINQKSVKLLRSNISSGFYIVQLIQGAQVIATKKIIITD